jgi:hypothetical protein
MYNVVERHKNKEGKKDPKKERATFAIIIGDSIDKEDEKEELGKRG